MSLYSTFCCGVGGISIPTTMLHQPEVELGWAVKITIIDKTTIVDKMTIVDKLECQVGLASWNEKLE